MAGAYWWRVMRRSRYKRTLRRSGVRTMSARRFLTGVVTEIDRALRGTHQGRVRHHPDDVDGDWQAGDACRLEALFETESIRCSTALASLLPATTGDSPSAWCSSPLMTDLRASPRPQRIHRIVGRRSGLR